MGLRNILRSTTAASGVEYAVLLGLLGVLSIGTVFGLGLEIDDLFTSVDDDLSIAQGVGSGEYADFDDGRFRRSLDEDECLILTDNGDVVVAADLSGSGKTCVYTLGGNDTLTLDALPGLDVHPGLGTDSIEMSGGSGTTFFYTGGDDTYQLTNGVTSAILRFEGLDRSDVGLSFETIGGTSNWDHFVFTTPSGLVRFENQGRYLDPLSGIGGAKTIIFDDQVVDIYDLKEEALLARKAATGDTMFGTFGNDRSLEPGLGNDTVYSGPGDDVITYEGGRDYYAPGAGQDVLKIPGLATTDATRYWHHSGRTWMEFGANRIGIEGQSTIDSGSNVAFSSIEFADQTMSAFDLRMFVLDWQENNYTSVVGTGQADPIDPTAVNTEVRPLGGDDTITYAAGTSFVIYSEDAGSERNSGTDVLDMSIYTSSQVTASQSGNNIILTTPTGAVTIKDQVKFGLGAAPTLNIETVVFSDTSWNEADIRTAAGVP